VISTPLWPWRQTNSNPLQFTSYMNAKKDKILWPM
jgi:hypothetical protein